MYNSNDDVNVTQLEDATDIVSNRGIRSPTGKGKPRKNRNSERDKYCGQGCGREVALQSLEVIYDFTKFISTKQFQLDSHLAQQAVGLMTATSVALAAIVIGFPVILGPASMKIPYILLTAVCSISCLVASLVCSVLAQRRLGDVVFENPTALINGDNTGQKGSPDFNKLAFVIDTLSDDYATSRRNYDRRNKLLALATYFFVAAIGVIIFFVLFATIATVFLYDHPLYSNPSSTQTTSPPTQKEKSHDTPQEKEHKRFPPMQDQGTNFSQASPYNFESIGETEASAAFD